LPALNGWFLGWLERKLADCASLIRPTSGGYVWGYGTIAPSALTYSA
jgi:hypothetical protein